MQKYKAIKHLWKKNSLFVRRGHSDVWTFHKFFVRLLTITNKHSYQFSSKLFFCCIMQVCVTALGSPGFQSHHSGFVDKRKLSCDRCALRDTISMESFQTFRSWIVASRTSFLREIELVSRYPFSNVYTLKIKPRCPFVKKIWATYIS